MNSREREDRLVKKELERLNKKNKKNNNNNSNNSNKPTNNRNNIVNSKNNGNNAGKSKKLSKNEKPFYRTTVFFSVIFFFMVFFYGYMLIFESTSIVNNSNNPRLKQYANTIVRGSILSSDGEKLAYTKVSSGIETRVYPFSNVFSHVVGMNSLDRGKTGLEQTCDYSLLTTNANPISKILHEFKGEKLLGNNVITTLDSHLQQAAYDSLGDNKGAVVILDSDTGEILAMVSKPDFDPNNQKELWENIDNNDVDSVLYNRATYGLYTPGSIFKIFTANEYLRFNSIEDFTFNCSGGKEFANYVIKCYDGKVHGNETLKDAFAYSCNGAFAFIGSELDMDKMNKNLVNMLFNKDLPVEFGHKNSRFNVTKDSSTFDKTQSAIGQGTTLVTPIHMAMITQAVYKEGEMYIPYLVKEVDGADGSVIQKNTPKKYKRIFSKENAGYLNEMMHAVTEYGTGSILKGDYDIAGKTGTAQIDNNNNVNSWFTGFATKNNKNITVTVVIENVQDKSAKAVNCVKYILDSI